jgi:hypothetical protein
MKEKQTEEPSKEELWKAMKKIISTLLKALCCWVRGLVYTNEL